MNGAPTAQILYFWLQPPRKFDFQNISTSLHEKCTKSNFTCHSTMISYWIFLIFFLVNEYNACGYDF
jgi:hypothetical protein